MKTTKKLFALLLAAAMLFSLAACGKGSNKPEATATPETAYVSEFTTFDQTYDRSMGEFGILYTDADGFIGVLQEKVGEREPVPGEVKEYEGQFDLYEPRLYSMDFTGKMTKLAYEPIKLELENEHAEQNSWISSLVKTESGYAALENVYAGWNDAPETVEPYTDEWESYSNYEEHYYITLLDKEGRRLKSSELDLEYPRSETDYFSPGRFVILDDGTMLACGETAIYAFNTDTGSYLYKIDGSFEWLSSLFRASDGTVYAAGYGMTADGSYNATVCPLDVKARRFGEGVPIDGDLYRIIPGDNKYLFYFNYGNYFCGYDKAKQESVRLFNWINVDVLGDDLQNPAVLPDGTIVGIMTEWDKNYENATRTLVSIHEVPYASLPQKTVLTLATDGMDYNVQRQLVKFNRASDSVRIEMQDYSQYDDYQTDYDESGYGENGGMTKLRTEILSGKMPDILDLSGMPTRQLAAKGLLMDLYPFLDADPSLSRDDIFPNVLKALETDGKLTSVSSGFYIQTCLASKRVVGDRQGWTYSDLNEALATMPEGCSVFDVGTTRDYVLRTMLELDMSSFVDWSTGKVNFESQDFIDLLTFVKGFPADFDWDNHEWTKEDESYYRVQQGQQLLLNFGLTGFEDLASYENIFGGPDSFTFIGYPTSKGVGNLMRVNSGFAVSRDCKDPQAAWEFLRILLTESYEEELGYNFPANRNLFEKQKKDAMTPTYVKDADGNFAIDPETGEREKEIKGWTFDPETMESIPVYAYTAEQIERAEKVIAVTDRVPDANKPLVDIVREQAQPFFAGQRSAEEVAKFVQSKANIYVNEQR